MRGLLRVPRGRIQEMRDVQPAAQPRAATRPPLGRRAVKKVLRLTGSAVLVLVAIRILDWLLAPALPFLMTLFVMVLVTYVVVSGRRGL